MIRIATVLICMVIADQSFASGPRIFHGCAFLEFQKDSVELTDDGKVKLVALLQNIQSLRVAGMEFTAWSDVPKGRGDHKRQLRLVEQRVKALKKIFVDDGIDERLMFENGRLPERMLIPHPVPSEMIHLKLLSSIAVVEYAGSCRVGYGAVCEQNRGHCKYHSGLLR